jgi:hypothetical protein
LPGVSRKTREARVPAELKDRSMGMGLATGGLKPADYSIINSSGSVTGDLHTKS